MYDLLPTPLRATFICMAIPLSMALLPDLDESDNILLNDCKGTKLYQDHEFLLSNYIVKAKDGMRFEYNDFAMARSVYYTIKDRDCKAYRTVDGDLVPVVSNQTKNQRKFSLFE